MRNHELINAGYVYYSNGAGRHYMLMWHTHADQCRAIVSRTLPGLDLAFERVVADHLLWGEDDDIAVFSCNLIHIVAPPVQMIDEAYTAAKATAAAAFQRTVVSEMIRHGLMRWPYMPCRIYERDESVKKQHHDHSRQYDPHRDCRNCTNGYALRGITPEEFFDRYALQWHNQISPIQLSDQQSGFSCAAASTDPDSTLVLSPYFNTAGVAGLRVAPCTVDELQRPVLFAFTVAVQLDTEPYAARVNELRMQLQQQNTTAQWLLEADRAAQYHADRNAFYRKYDELINDNSVNGTCQ